MSRTIFQQNMIPFPVMAKPEIRSDYHALYMQTFYNPCNKSLRLHAHYFFGKRTFQQVINSTLFENFLLFFIGRKDTVIIILRKFFGGISNVKTTAFNPSFFFSRRCSISASCPRCTPSNFPSDNAVGSSI